MQKLPSPTLQHSHHSNNSSKPNQISPSMETTSTQHPHHHSYSNGHHHKKLKPSPIAPPTTLEFRECLKNHAASLGGHAVDGCCEYTPSLSSSPSVPSSLLCSACGCHRNFHRQRPRLDDNSPNNISSDPQPLLETAQKRRARTKFTPEQKSKMHELAEWLGWRMPKRDVEGSIEGACRRIGVERSVFKVWMHNNKQGIHGCLSEVGSLRFGGGLGNGGFGVAEGTKNYMVNASACSSSDHGDSDN